MTFYLLNQAATETLPPFLPLAETMAAQTTKPTPGSSPDAVMAEQEALATAKYGNLAPKNAAAMARRRQGMKRFDSADWMMSKGGDGGEATLQPAPTSLLARTLEAEGKKPH